MKALTESLKLIQEHIDLQMYGHAWDKCQELIDAVNARDNEPVYQVAMNGTWFDTNLVGYIKHSGVKRTLFTSPQPNQSAYIKRLEAQIKRLTNAIETVLAVVESSLYLDDEELHNLQNKLEQALASKESIDG